MLKLFYALTATAFLVSGSAVHAQQLKGFTDDHAKHSFNSNVLMTSF